METLASYAPVSACARFHLLRSEDLRIDVVNQWRHQGRVILLSLHYSAACALRARALAGRPVRASEPREGLYCVLHWFTFSYSDQSPSRAPRAATMTSVRTAATIVKPARLHFARTARALRDATCVSEASCPNFEPRAHARLTGLTTATSVRN